MLVSFVDAQDNLRFIVGLDAFARVDFFDTNKESIVSMTCRSVDLADTVLATPISREDKKKIRDGLRFGLSSVVIKALDGHLLPDNMQRHIIFEAY